MIVLIDNYDSFSYNLYQRVGSLHSDIRTIRNDKATVGEIEALDPEAILLSPGPGRPEEAGICVETVRRLAGQIPILGVCLGHQAIGAALGANISLAAKPMHGKASRLFLDWNCPLFTGLPIEIDAARYHSLIILRDERFPTELAVTAETEEGEIMAIAHRSFPLFGLQFHPESILTPTGSVILQNFLDAANRFNRERERRAA